MPRYPWWPVSSTRTSVVLSRVDADHGRRSEHQLRRRGTPRRSARGTAHRAPWPGRRRTPCRTRCGRAASRSARAACRPSPRSTGSASGRYSWRLGEVTVPLEDLVAEHEVITERGGQISASVRWSWWASCPAGAKIRSGSVLRPHVLQGVLDPLPAGRQPAVRQVEHRDLQRCARAERRERRPLLLLAQASAAGEDQRVHPDAGVRAAHLEQCAAGADREVVAVRTDQEHLVQPLWEQTQHHLSSSALMAACNGFSVRPLPEHPRPRPRPGRRLQVQCVP